MSLIADILLAAGAFGVALYCFVLSRRLTRFTNLERGVGGAVAVLSSQVDDLTKAMHAARTAADESGKNLEALTGRAEEVARRLELHVASLHDLDPGERAAAEPAPPEKPAGRREESGAEAAETAPEAVETPQVARAESGEAGAGEKAEESQLRAVPTFRSVSAQAMKAESAPAARKVTSYFASRAAAPAK